MARKSNAVEWKQHSDIKIKIKPSDEVIPSKTNNVSVTPLNKRGYAGLNATVILGSHKVVNNQIRIKEGVRIWTCKIDQRGAVSSIGLPEEEVTVIVHEANKIIS